MGVDEGTVAAIAALAVAFVALIVAFAQALQQYLVSGQLIRICDSVVYGKLPGQGHRIWQYSQFRFRVVYSIPQISLSPSLWLGISSHTRASDTKSRALPSLKVSGTNVNQTSIAGEASWVSFTRAVQHPCGQSLRYRMVEGDADRCPADLPVVPMQLSMRDVVVAAIMAGMNCTDVSFPSQSLSMQGDVGTITSSRHPVLGALIHFAPKQPYEEHGIRANDGTVSADWVARMVDIVTVAGYRYDSRDRKHFEEDESSWAKSSSIQSRVRNQGQQPVSTSNVLRKRRPTDALSTEPRPTRHYQDPQLPEQPAFLNLKLTSITLDVLRRPHDGLWSFAANVPRSPLEPPDSQESNLDHSGRLRMTWFRNVLRFSRRLWKTTPKLSSAPSSEVLPVIEPKDSNPQQVSQQTVGAQSTQASRQEEAATSGREKLEQPLPAQDNPRKERLTTYIAERRRLEPMLRKNETARKPANNQLIIFGKDEPNSHLKGRQDQYFTDRGSDVDNDRAEYLVKKWQEIFKQRQRNRSRGRSHSNRLITSQSSTPRRRSANSASRGTVASHGSRRQKGRRQLRLKGFHRTSSTESDVAGHQIRLPQPKRLRSGENTHSGVEQQARKTIEQSAIHRQTSLQNVPPEIGLGSRDYHIIKNMSRYDSSISGTNLEVMDDPSRRGRRRNPSLVKESSNPTVLAYGKKPVRSNSSVRIANDLSESTNPAISKQLPKRKVRMVSPSPQGSTNSELAARDDAHRTMVEPKSALRRPTQKFPEDPPFLREGVAPLRAASSEIPRDARWTKIDRRLVNPEALESGNERFEEREHHVIVLRVLTKEEIEQYALRTAELRNRRYTFENNMEESLSSHEQRAISDEEDEIFSSDSESTQVSFERRPLDLQNQEHQTDTPHLPLDQDGEARKHRHATTDPPTQPFKDTLNDFPGAKDGTNLVDQNQYLFGHPTETLKGQPASDNRTARTPAPEAGDRQMDTKGTRLSLDLNEQTLSYEEELLFLDMESVLKRTRESTKQCKDIVVTLKFFADNQPSVGAEVNDIYVRVRASNTLIKRCLRIIEPLRGQKKLAAFVTSEVNTMVHGFRVSLDALEAQFGLFEITPMSFSARQQAWDNFCSSFEERHSCSVLQHLDLSYHFGQEIVANLEAGILSSPESNLLKARITRLSSLGGSSGSPISPISLSRNDPPLSQAQSRFLESPSRFTQPPPSSVDSVNTAKQRRDPRDDRKSRVHRATNRKAPEIVLDDYNRSSDSLDTDNSTNPSDQSSTESTLTETRLVPTGEMNWLWVCQADLIPGFWATPWKTLFSEAVCIGAISVLLNVLESFTDRSNCRYVKTQDYCQAWIEAGKSTFPGYAHNANGGLVVSGVFAPVKFESLEKEILPIEFLHSYSHQVNRAYFHSTHIARDSLGELVGLDSWLSMCGRLPEITDGPSDLLRTLPTLIQGIMTDFNLEFSSLDRTSSDGGLRMIRTIADSLVQLYMDNNLSTAEQLFASVALMRTVKFALCVARGTDTLRLRDVLLHDVQVYMA